MRHGEQRITKNNSNIVVHTGQHIARKIVRVAVSIMRLIVKNVANIPVSIVPHIGKNNVSMNVCIVQLIVKNFMKPRASIVPRTPNTSQQKRLLNVQYKMAPWYVLLSAWIAANGI